MRRGRLRKLQERAKRIANMAEAKGEIKKPDSCQECGFKTPRLDKHHQDYNKPKEVIYLCRSCHRSLHQGYLSKFTRKRYEIDIIQKRRF